jgi:hypothetical protein
VRSLGRRNVEVRAFTSLHTSLYFTCSPLTPTPLPLLEYDLATISVVIVTVVVPAWLRDSCHFKASHLTQGHTSVHPYRRLHACPTRRHAVGDSSMYEFPVLSRARLSRRVELTIVEISTSLLSCTAAASTRGLIKICLAPFVSAAE